MSVETPLFHFLKKKMGHRCSVHCSQVSFKTFSKSVRRSSENKKTHLNKSFYQCWTQVMFYVDDVLKVEFSVCFLSNLPTHIFHIGLRHHSRYFVTISECIPRINLVLSFREKKERRRCLLPRKQIKAANDLVLHVK